MTDEEILKQWEIDCDIDITDLSMETRRFAKLHHKYYYILNNERARLTKFEKEFTKLKGERSIFLITGVNKEYAQARGWGDKNGLRVEKSNLHYFLESDEDYGIMNAKVARQKDKVNMIESIIKKISSISFDIRNIIEDQKYKNGG